jgi:hypothetical protein
VGDYSFSDLFYLFCSNYKQVKLDGVVSVAVVGVKDEFYGEVSILCFMIMSNDDDWQRGSTGPEKSIKD